MVTILYARRIAIVNGDTDECQRLLDRACQVGNTYIYIGIKVQHEIYRSSDIRRICHLNTSEEIRGSGARPSDIIYTTGFGLRSDPILAYVTVTLKLLSTVEYVISGTTPTIVENAGRMRNPVTPPAVDPPAIAPINPVNPSTSGVNRINNDTIRQCRLFYNKNETSGRQMVNALTRREVQITLAGRLWSVIRVSAREDRITQYSTNAGAPSDPVTELGSQVDNQTNS